MLFNTIVSRRFVISEEYPMFGRRRKVVEESGLECPLCHLKNNDDAAACSRCYYDFHSSASQQTTNLDSEESAGLLDLLTGEGEVEEDEGETVDWSAHSFEMEDVTIDVQQYDDIGSVQVSGTPTFATQLVDTSKIGNDTSTSAELLAGDAPENVERFVVPKPEIAAWTETLEHRVQLVNPTTGNGKGSDIDLDLDLDDSNWYGASSKAAQATQTQATPQTTPQTSPQSTPQATTRTLPPTPQATPPSTLPAIPPAIPPATQIAATQPVQVPQHQAPLQQSTPHHATSVQAAANVVDALPVNSQSAAIPQPTAPLPTVPNAASANGAAIPSPAAVPATSAAPTTSAAVLPSLPNGATGQTAASVPTLPPSPIAAPPSSAFQTPSPVPFGQQTANAPTQPVHATAPTVAKSLPPVPTSTPVTPTEPHPTATATATAGVWPWPQQQPFEDRVIAQSIRQAMEAAKGGDKESALRTLNEVGPHLGSQWRLLYPIGALMRNLGREAELKNMLNIAAARYPNDEAVKAAVAKLG